MKLADISHENKCHMCHENNLRLECTAMDLCLLAILKVFRDILLHHYFKGLTVDTPEYLIYLNNMIK